MADNVNATPGEVRQLAQDIGLGINKLMELNDYVLSGLNQLSQTFQDEGFAEYQDAINGIQSKLAQIAENELAVALKGLVSFADQLEAAQSA